MNIPDAQTRQYRDGDYLRAFIVAFLAKYQPSLMNGNLTMEQVTEQAAPILERNDILFERRSKDKEEIRGYGWVLEHKFTPAGKRPKDIVINDELLASELTTQISKSFDEEFRSLVRWVRAMLDINSAVNMAVERYSLPATESRAIWPVHQFLQTKLRQQQEVAAISTGNPVWAAGTNIDFMINPAPIQPDPWLSHLVGILDSSPGKIGIVSHQGEDWWVFIPTKQAFQTRIYPTLFPAWLHELIFRVHRFSVPLLDTIDAK